MKVDDAGFCGWLRDEAKVNALEVLNMNKENSCREVNLSEQYREYLENNRLSEEVVRQIKSFKHSHKPQENLTSEQELLVNQLMFNKKLRDRYKNYGLCKECQQPNTGIFSYSNLAQHQVFRYYA